jgi:hypothetical protein
MATKRRRVLVDDTDGSPADETIRFRLDDMLFEIDLSWENAEMLRTVFAPYVAAARKVGNGLTAQDRAANLILRATARFKQPRAPKARTVVDPVQNRAIREWGRNHPDPAISGRVHQRGAIPQDIRDLYSAAR